MRRRKILEDKKMEVWNTLNTKEKDLFVKFKVLLDINAALGHELGEDYFYED